MEAKKALAKSIIRDFPDEACRRSRRGGFRRIFSERQARPTRGDLASASDERSC